MQVVRIRFPAANSHVGTDRPVIPDDGEGPRRAVKLGAFELEATTVTNARFAEFIAATGHVTEAERFGWAPVFRGLLPEGLGHAPVGAQIPWWLRIDGANWRSPEGPGSTIHARTHHPAVQVSWNDAMAFAAWCGGRLPTEAEWEHAARGGAADPRFPWGDDEPSDQAVFCNIWQGPFPRAEYMRGRFFWDIPLLMRFHRTAPGSMAWRAMSGNGLPIPFASARSGSLRGSAMSRPAATVTRW
jgi:sulfatase modifying factor 1